MISSTRYCTYIINTPSFIPKNCKMILSIFFIVLDLVPASLILYINLKLDSAWIWFKKTRSLTRYSTYIINTPIFIPKNYKNVLSIFFMFWIVPASLLLYFDLKCDFAELWFQKYDIVDKILHLYLKYSNFYIKKLQKYSKYFLYVLVSPGIPYILFQFKMWFRRIMVPKIRYRRQDIALIS
jgi:hypothetical protein